MTENGKWHWIIEVAMEPSHRADLANLIEALDEISVENTGFGYRRDADTGQIILGADDELGLEGAVERVRTVGGCEINVGALQVCYRETILKIKEVDHTHSKRTNGRCKFARVKLRVEPLDKGVGIEFDNECESGTLPAEYVSAAEKGMDRALDAGVLVGFPMLDVKVTLVDGVYHDTESNAKAFETAARTAVMEALQGAWPVLLEPVMAVEVVTPEYFMGDVIGDLNSRRGRISGTEFMDNSATVSATAPVAQMFGYANTLAEMTANWASYTARFSHYERVPTRSDNDPPGTEPAAAALRA